MSDAGAGIAALEGRSTGGYRAVSKSNNVTYPETMEAAFPDKERVAEAKARLEEAGVKYVFSCWVDLMGQPKTKPVPIGEFEAICYGKGPQFAVHSVSMVPGTGPGRFRPDPDPRSRQPGDLPLGSAPAPGSSPTSTGRTSPTTSAPASPSSAR